MVFFSYDKSLASVKGGEKMPQRYVEMPNGLTIYEDGTVITENGDVGSIINLSPDEFEKMVDVFEVKITESTF